jgi:hypothetical protein
MDIANSVPGNVLEFMDASQIKTITTDFKIVLGIVSGLLVVGELYLLYSIVKNRKHPVMTLAQAPFLALLTACGIIATACCFVYMPVRDAFCNMRGILIHIPLTTMSAILVGRLWRIYSTLSIALGLGTKKRKMPLGGKITLDFLSTLANVHLPWRRKSIQSKRDPLRTKITDVHLLKVIFFLTLPQITLQILGIALFPLSEVTIQIDEGSEVGRQVCTIRGRWPIYVAAVMEGFLFLMAVYVAYVTRDLPSIFNEKRAIFTAAIICGVVNFGVIALIYISDSNTMSPNLSVSFESFNRMRSRLTTLTLDCEYSHPFGYLWLC